MDEPTIAQLKSENERLNRIINLLLEQNEQTRGVLSLLKIELGKARAVASLAENELGKSQTVTSLATMQDILERTVPSLPTSETVSERPVPSLPAIISADADTVLGLLPMLKGSPLNFARPNERKGIIRLLIHIYNGGSGAHPALRAITNTTESGTAKAVTSLRKKGWIKTVAWQKLALTDMAMEKLRAAYASISREEKPPAETSAEKK